MTRAFTVCDRVACRRAHEFRLDSPPAFFVCAGCQRNHYCDPACVEQDRETHRAYCGKQKSCRYQVLVDALKSRPAPRPGTYTLLADDESGRDLIGGALNADLLEVVPAAVARAVARDSSIVQVRGMFVVYAPQAQV